MLGWLLLSAALAAFAWAFVAQRRRKAADRLKPSPYSVMLNLFAIVHVPADVPRDRGELYAHSLRDAYIKLWDALRDIYGMDAGPLCVDKIRLTNGEVDKDHPHVMWTAPHGAITLRIQDGMERWFAHEMHNVFRYLLHGMSGIRGTMSAFDHARAETARAWITNTL